MLHPEGKSGRFFSLFSTVVKPHSLMNDAMDVAKEEKIHRAGRICAYQTLSSYSLGPLRHNSIRPLGHEHRVK